MLTLEGLVRNVLATSYKEKIDPMTGDVTPASTVHKVQIEYNQPQASGDVKIVIDDFTIKIDGDPSAYVEGFKKCIGKMVRLPVALWKIDGKAGLAIPKGIMPILISRPAV